MMAESEVLQELGSRLASREQGTENRHNEREHGSISMILAAQNSSPINGYGVFSLPLQKNHLGWGVLRKVL